MSDGHFFLDRFKSFSHCLPILSSSSLFEHVFITVNPPFFDEKPPAPSRPRLCGRVHGSGGEEPKLPLVSIHATLGAEGFGFGGFGGFGLV